MNTLRKSTSFFIILFLAACASSPSGPTRLTASDANSTVELHLEDTLEISLEGNPTTGYSWEIPPDECGLLEQQGESDFQSDSDALGSGGVVTLRFTAVQEGQMTCDLVYHRSFEPGVAPINNFSFQLIVSK
jgi:inhibitor of cysteine peptidase